MMERISKETDLTQAEHKDKVYPNGAVSELVGVEVRYCSRSDLRARKAVALDGSNRSVRWRSQRQRRGEGQWCLVTKTPCSLFEPKTHL